MGKMYVVMLLESSKVIGAGTKFYSNLKVKFNLFLFLNHFSLISWIKILLILILYINTILILIDFDIFSTVYCDSGEGEESNNNSASISQNNAENESQNQNQNLNQERNREYVSSRNVSRMNWDYISESPYCSGTYIPLSDVEYKDETPFTGFDIDSLKSLLKPSMDYKKVFLQDPKSMTESQLWQNAGIMRDVVTNAGSSPTPVDARSLEWVEGRIERLETERGGRH
uniref:Uncharacterized protein n=1 Tax=Clonostachys compactiuscula TaxID=122660 RepID=A0A8F1Y2G1_9HYPO|nr:hypothetical protein [Clonostachys compactiuscula]